jgi:hypothetical protein
MTPEIRRAALRAAAKAALVVSLGSLGALGCSGGARTAPSNTTATTPDPTPVAEATCDEYLAGLEVTKGPLPDGDPLKDAPAVYAAFVDVAARAAARTQECCTEQLARDNAQAAQRFECCSALGTAADAMACTPWGPPCPPAMA